ncbi:MAG: hypothetical protein JST92_09020 [Deltaproteobacteria bacterium]|nr:hypothetical protein [Deltaproteobacteria bacterium]
MLQRALFVLACVSFTGCASTLAEGLRSDRRDTAPFTEHLIDERASEFTWLSENVTQTVHLRGEVLEGSEGMDPAGVQSLTREELEKARRLVVDALNGALHAKAGDEVSKRMRIRVSNGLGVSVAPLGACLVVLTLLGCPVGYTDQSIELTLEAHGKVYQGHGNGRAWLFLYSLDGSDQLALGRALGEALDEVLAKARAGAK